MTDKITPEHLRRKAVVYIRQSTPGQVSGNLESQRRQYALREVAEGLGFAAIEVIDDDLGRSGSGSVKRPGFERLVAAICTGEVGMVFCLEASRLARNGRDWHHVVDLCGLVGTLVADADGVYDPRIGNDRLLLGLKGTMSEFELGLIRQRSLEAIRAKASRGELEYALPIGLAWTHHSKIELDPDRRIQKAIHLVFRRFIELGSARQTLLWFRGEKVTLPAIHYGQFGREIRWANPVYSTILKFLQNPLYAGAYVFGRRETRTQIVDGRAHKSDGHLKPMDRWTVLLREHHPGYISWQQFERNQLVLEENAHMKSGSQKAGRGGRCLLAGLLRCRRCGRMLHVGYTGSEGSAGRYFCRGAHLNHGTGRCISFGALRPDQTVATEILRALEGSAVDAALQAAERLAMQDVDQRKALEVELEQARYEARLAARRHEAVDPDQRLVAAELEARWNGTLARVQEIESRLDSLSQRKPSQRTPDRAALLALAQDLPAAWNAPSIDERLRQRLVRLLIQEIVADVDEGSSEIVLTLHWVGGRHSELRVLKNKTGRHHRCTDLEAVEVVRRMAGKWSDEQIAATLNRLGLRTGAGNAWIKARVASLRSYHGFPPYDPARPNTTLTLEQAAESLGVSETVVRRLIATKVLPAAQVVASAPWEIAPGALELATVKAAVGQVRAGSRAPRSRSSEDQLSIFPSE